MLHLTNEDSVAALIRKIGVSGDVVAWRDALYVGPVPPGLPLEAMSETRARFIASCRWGSFAEVMRQLSARDAALRAARRVVLWFEHDLNDQLQLIQILAAVAQQRETAAEMIVVDAFPGISPFHGLAQLTPAQLASLWPKRQPVTSAQLTTAARAWKTFTSADPAALRAFVASDLSPLPLLRNAFERLLEEYPAAPSGLSRTERQILEAIGAGRTQFDEVFQANQQAEAVPFVSDAGLQVHLDALAFGRTPLVVARPALQLTDAGARVRSGQTDARTLNGIDRWIGGVRLKQ